MDSIGIPIFRKKIYRNFWKINETFFALNIRCCKIKVCIMERMKKIAVVKLIIWWHNEHITIELDTNSHFQN